MTFYSVGCDAGEYGENCQEACGACIEGTCDSGTGQCVRGCQDGYTGALCKTGDHTPSPSPSPPVQTQTPLCPQTLITVKHGYSPLEFKFTPLFLRLYCLLTYGIE